MSQKTDARSPREIAKGVYYLPVRGVNVYFVRSGSSWVLIDTAWPKNGRLIREAAASLFGENARPAAILLTHVHPDHQGSAAELARLWELPVYVHGDDLPLLAGEVADCVFRTNSATDSVSNRPAIPIHSGHRFRLNPATHSDSFRPPPGAH
jgi:glyoxylase-like metal-dependent hydrolase (beta-lactamase superfamily II)